jgi:hypothetical protein
VAGSLTPNTVLATEFVPGSGWTQPKILFSGRQDGTNVLENPGASVDSVDDLGVGIGQLSIADKVTFDPTFTTTYTAFSLRYTAQTGWQKSGSLALDPIWPTNATSVQKIQTLSTVAFSDGSQLAVGNTSGVAALYFNTYR